MNPEPIYDLAHLGHMELLTPKPEESLKFFVEVMGMTVSGQKGESAYLRGWDDYERYSLKLTGSKTSGMGHMAFRARSQQALERRAAALKGSEFEIGWTDGDMGQGRRSADPGAGLKPIVWTEDERKKGQAWGPKTIDGTPPVTKA